MKDFWITANTNFSAKERREYNAWKRRLCVAADGIRDATRWSEDVHLQSLVTDLLREVHKVPTMLPKG